MSKEMTMHDKVKYILEDRYETIQEFPRYEYDDEGWEGHLEEIRELREALESDSINDTAEYTLLEYSHRDGYCDPSEGYLRAINRELALAGRLTVDDGKSEYFPCKPDTCQVNGVKYFAAV